MNWRHVRGRSRVGVMLVRKGEDSLMKGVLECVKTTAIGGLIVILPVAVAVMVLAKLVGVLLAVLRPVAAELPGGAPFSLVV